MANKKTKLCPHCKAYNFGDSEKCCLCGKKLRVALFECISSSCNIEVGTDWKLCGTEYTIGSSEDCDIVIEHPDILPQHCRIVYKIDEKQYYYLSLSDKKLPFEKRQYKILEGAILPILDIAEFKLRYIKSC